MPAPRGAGPMRAAETSKPLRELAAVIRSKNAGPFRITFDILFTDREAYRRVCASRVLSRESIANRFAIPPSQVSSIFEVDMANAIKFTIIRPINQCAPGERDVYGAQQHAPLLDIEVPLP